MTNLEKLTTALFLIGIALIFVGTELVVEMEQASGIFAAIIGAGMAGVGVIIDNNL